MIEDYRLKKYLEKKYYNCLFGLVETELNKGFNMVDDHVYLRDISINTVLFAHKGIDTFFCSLYVDAIINDSNDYKEDGSVKRYFVKCEGHINNDGIRLFSFNVEEEPTRFPYLMKNSFMPIFKKEEYDNIAKDFIHKYCPSFVSTGSININEIMKNLNLELKVLSLRGYGDIYGMIAFENMNVNTHTEGGSIIPANTIVLNADRRSIYSDDMSRDLFTVVHECIHKELHYKHYLFNKQFNNSSETAIKCETTGVYNEDENIREMEKQANAIASKVLLPEMKLLNSVETYKNSHNLITANDYYELLERLKEEFKVSYSALKIRLIELGYSKFIGIREYMDGEMVRPYISTKKIENNESYTISKKDFIRLEISTPTLKQLLRDYTFIYVEGHVCLDNPKYIERINGKPIMSEYALNNIDECCLKFEYSFKTEYSEANTSYLLLCRLDGYVSPNPRFKNHSIGEEATVYNAELWKEKNKELLEFRKKSLNNDLANNLRQVIGASELTQELVAEYTTVSLSTIEKILSGKNTKPKMSTLMLICVGLHLPPIISNDLFKSAGYNLDDTNLKTQWVRDAIFIMYSNDARDIRKMYEETFNEESE